LQALIDAVGADRVGVKLSPEFGFNDLTDATPQETYGRLVAAMAPLGLAYLHVALANVDFDYHGLFRPLFPGSYLRGGGLTQAAADDLLENGAADAAVFGALFVANPDLPRRFERNAVLNSPDPKTLYGGGAEGYIDY